MAKVVAIIQARMGSTRLPGKSLMDLGGAPVTAWSLRRARRAQTLDEVVLATSVLPEDDDLARLAATEQVGLFRGDPLDVLDRYRAAAAASEADIVVRLTADCPFIDPALIDQVVGFYRENCERFDYVSNVVERTFPKGLDTQVFSREALEIAAREATDPVEREHVTTFFYNQADRFRRGSVGQEIDRSQMRWTLDYQEDLDFMRAVVERLEEPFSQAEIAALLEAEPELIQLLGSHAWC